MEEKIFNLLEKMYIEIKETKKEVQEAKAEVKENRNDIIKIENEMSNKFGILFDASKSMNERLDRIENKLDIITSKVDRHDIQIQVIEGGKKKTI